MTDLAMTLDEARQRLDYRLKFTCTRKPREFDDGYINADSVPDAYKRGRERSPGEWNHTIPEWLKQEDDPGDRPRQLLRMAVAEAIHEVLEWLWLDGRPLLDPHGKAEQPIYDVCDAFADRLYELRDA